MPEAHYDAVVLGGGHHATIIACYLARAGLSVGVFERAPHLGGGANTSEGPAPGFLMNHCSHWTRFYGHPAYRDFNLYDEGLRYVFPEGNEGMIFEDGSSFIGFSAARVVDERTGRTEPWSEGVQRTHEQIQRFSKRDADTYLRLLEKFEKYWKPAFRKHRFSAPTPWGEPDALEELLRIPDSGIEPVHQFMSLRQLAYDFFESDELRTLFMRAATTSTGCYPDDVPGLAGARPQPPTRALVRARRDRDRRQPGDQRRARLGRAQAAGGVLHRAARSSAIKVEADRATGIVLADGTHRRRRRRRQRARRSADGAAAARGRARSTTACATGSATSTTTGASSSGPTTRCTSRPRTSPPRPTRASGRSRASTGARRIPTTWRRGTSPRSTSTASHSGRSSSARSTRSGTRRARRRESTWSGSRSSPRRGASSPPRSGRRSRRASPITSSTAWQRYAPNMTPDNVIAMSLYGPDDIEDKRPDMIEGGYSAGSTIASQLGRFRPVPELSGYRMMLDNLYNCSSNMHSGSGIGRGSSLNCFDAIADDLGLSVDARSPAAAGAG